MKQSYNSTAYEILLTSTDKDVTNTIMKLTKAVCNHNEYSMVFILYSNRILHIKMLFYSKSWIRMVFLTASENPSLKRNQIEVEDPVLVSLIESGLVSDLTG